MGDHAPHFALAGVNNQLGLDMLDVEEPDSLGAPGSAGPGERSPLGARRRGGIRALGTAARLRTQADKMSQTPKLRISLDMLFPD